MKICSKCHTEKSLENFNKRNNGSYRTICRECNNNRKRDLRKNKNYPITSDISKICKTCKIEKLINNFTRDKNNKDGLCTQCKYCRSKNSKKVYIENSEIIKSKNNLYYHNNKELVKIDRRKRLKERTKKDPFFKLTRKLRNRLYYALKNKNWKKNTHFSEYIGCDRETLIKHFESKFTQEMNWKNHGKLWDIDHIIPLSSAPNEQMMYNLCHYKNLQPLCSNINRNIKKDKADVCWQKLQRDRLLEEDLKLGFPTNLKVSDFILQQEKITKEHRDFIERYEWLGTIGFGVRYVFTARYNGSLGGIVMLAEPNAYQFDKNLESLIQRGACASWTPKNLGSRLIMFSCKWMVNNTSKRIFVAYSDPEAGEIGTIYQACNFDYIGNNFGSSYVYLLSNGKQVTDRYFTRTSSMKKWARELDIKWEKSWSKPNGFQDITSIPKDIYQKLKDYAKSKYENLSIIKKKLKGKYVLLLKNNRKEVINKQWIALPYPKRK